MDNTENLTLLIQHLQDELELVRSNLLAADKLIKMQDTLIDLLKSQLEERK